jgi:two-component system sensor histidine kinase HydH
MGSDGRERRPSSDRLLFGPRTLALVWAPIAVVGVLHYATASDVEWIHDVLRRLYYLPIVVAAFRHGVRGGLAAALVVSLTYLPHAFLHLGHLLHSDPGDTVNKAIEIALYNALGGLAGSFSDALRRRQRELEHALDEQRRLQERLVRAGRLSALGEVVAGIAHEIKNPIHALKGTAEIVAPLIPVDAEERRMWELHVAELDRLERVAARFLSFSNPQRGAATEIDLREVAQRTADLVGADARRRGIAVEVRLGESAAPVLADRDQLAQVAMNVIVNAMRAIGERGGRIRVTVAAADLDRVATPASEPAVHVLRIENDGPPIAEAELEQLFDPFFSRSPEGTGLGLSIAERIMEQHDGYIEAANAGLGVSFSLCLPAR